jgi:putative peptide zinc metalloprotease protein
MRRVLMMLAALVAAIGLSIGCPAAARADGNGGNTTAVAINTKDGSSLFRFAFGIKRVMGDVVDNGNAAVAFASCTDCRTVAISIQIVLVMSSPSVVTPQNLAFAENLQCSFCVTVASAYQFVIGTSGPVKFTPEGRKAISDIRKELRDLGDSDLPAAELQARISQLMDRLREVLQTQLVPAGPGEEEPGEEENSESGKTKTVTTGATPTSTVTTTTTEPATTTGTTTEGTTTSP